MSLEKLKTLTDDTRELLEADDWTIERLAHARKSDLTPYKGIGDVTAERIIDEAELVLESMEEGEKPKTKTQFQEGVYSPKQPGVGSPSIPTTPPEKMSVRVKRIQEAN